MTGSQIVEKKNSTREPVSSQGPDCITEKKKITQFLLNQFFSPWTRGIKQRISNTFQGTFNFKYSATLLS